MKDQESEGLQTSQTRYWKLENNEISKGTDISGSQRLWQRTFKELFSESLLDYLFH